MASLLKSVAVLVVEDENLVRMLSVWELEDAGYEVLQAESAAEALTILESGAHVALLFTDVNMPGKLDGLDLARLVHARWPDVRLMITSGGGKVGPEDVPDDGRFIPKPYSLGKMTALVREMTGRPA